VVQFACSVCVVGGENLRKFRRQHEEQTTDRRRQSQANSGEGRRAALIQQLSRRLISISVCVSYQAGMSSSWPRRSYRHLYDANAQQRQLSAHAEIEREQHAPGMLQRGNTTIYPRLDEIMRRV
jgi:hypothetical protein